MLTVADRVRPRIERLLGLIAHRSRGRKARYRGARKRRCRPRGRRFWSTWTRSGRPCGRSKPERESVGDRTSAEGVDLSRPESVAEGRSGHGFLSGLEQSVTERLRQGVTSWSAIAARQGRAGSS